MRKPIDGNPRISTQFNVPDSAAKFGRHSGIDYAVGTGTNVYAPEDGEVTDWTFETYQGHVVQIKSAGVYHRLMHNTDILVSPGQHVVEGQLVARSGATGKGVTGPHVHHDISPSKIPTKFDFINPIGYPGSFPPPTPQQVADPLAGKTLFLHPVPRWRVYPVDVIPKVGNEKGVLLPGSFREGPNGQPGLTYRIISSTKYPHTVTIRTQAYGVVNIYVDSDGEIY
jgi:murein DD-endopeptidase MepM/ murein hydrolase activator NlpD